MREYLSGLPLRDRAAAADVLDEIREHGLQAPGVRFKQIREKLWEFYVEAGASYRIFHVTVTGPMMVLLHAYKKKAKTLQFKRSRLPYGAPREGMIWFR